MSSSGSGSESEIEHNDNSDSSENESDNHNDEEERAGIRDELKTMSFEELMKLKEKLGSKVYNEALFGTTSKIKRNIKKSFKRENPNRPMEMSSKRPVRFGLDQRRKKEELIADPRFNSKCGDYDSAQFKERYEFVNDMRENELVELKTKLKKCKDEIECQKLRVVIQRLQNQLVEENKRKKKVEEKNQESVDKRKHMEEHEKPFYMKKSHKKAHEMVKQYLELKNSGKLEKHLEKRRKKIISRDRKKFNFD